MRGGRGGNGGTGGNGGSVRVARELLRLRQTTAACALAAAAAVSAPACADIGTESGGVIALEVVPPVPPQVEVGDTITITATALDIDGNPVDAPILWSTPDAANIFVDPATGRVAGLTAGTTGRVMVSSGSLVSEFISLSVLAGADTVEVPADTLVVAPGETASPPVAPRVLADVAGVLTPSSGRAVILTIVEPVYADPATRAFEFTGNAALADTVLTGADGIPTPPVTVSRVAGLTAPDTVEVEVVVRRRSGATVPGSGQRVVIVFQ
ncbi:MAG TPA: hypothetical protein VFU00_04010 [Gemmatimonadales bacterium]|nr:hypothetical protein [Gemmatimonadales bacterium]